MHPNYIKRFQEIATLLLKKTPPEYLITDWYDGKWETASFTLQDWFADSSKFKWMTGIDTIEAVQNIIEGAIGNANLREDYTSDFGEDDE